MLPVGAIVSHVGDTRVATPAEFYVAASQTDGDVRISVYDRVSRPTLVVGESVIDED